MAGLVAMPLIAQLAMQQSGWRSGWLAIGSLTLVVGFVPVWLFMVRRPEDLGLLPDRQSAADVAGRRPQLGEPSFSRREAVGTAAFWLLLLYTVLVYPVQAGVSLHQAAHLIERGIAPTIAAAIVSTFSLMSAVASLACGFLPRSLPIRYPMALIGVLLTARDITDGRNIVVRTGYVAAALFGFGIGGLLTLLPIAWADYFGRANYAAIRSARIVGAGAGAGGGPAALGRAARLDRQLRIVVAVLRRALRAQHPGGADGAPAEIERPKGEQHPAGCCKCGRMHYDSFDRLGRHGMERGHHIDIHNIAYFHHVYDSEQPDMRRLYEQAKIDQWNAATDIDWEQPLEGDGGLIADDLVDIHGTKFWDRLSDAKRVELNRCVSRWRISTLMAGEHGAMLVCSQLVENVVGQDAKLFQATQVVDEARHNEVLQRYVTLRLDGETYPLAGNVREIFDTLLGTSAWYLKTIGLQLVAETFAVSLFRMLAESSKDAILRQVCRRILQDEARHMGFGMLSLPAVVAEASAAERREMEDFAVWALNRTLRGIFPLAAYEEMGFDRADIGEIKLLRRERAAGGEETAFRKYFRRDLHAGLVRNLRKVGVLTPRIEPDIASLGISLAA